MVIFVLKSLQFVMNFYNTKNRNRKISISHPDVCRMRRLKRDRSQWQHVYDVGLHWPPVQPLQSTTGGTVEVLSKHCHYSHTSRIQSPTHSIPFCGMQTKCWQNILQNMPLSLTSEARGIFFSQNSIFNCWHYVPLPYFVNGATSWWLVRTITS